jgi:hypothetical protein
MSSIPGRLKEEQTRRTAGREEKAQLSNPLKI